MSRIGKRVLSIPENVNVNVEGSTVTVKGPKGELSLELVKNIAVKVEDGTVTVEPLKDDKFTHAMHGTTNANIRNMIIGVSDGYKKGLEIVGVGYKFNVQGNKLTISAGYSHPVVMEVPSGITVKAISNTEIELEGIDKEKVGEFAANIRKVRKPEPYKGKGIKYKGEQIRRKEGKKASK
ncbi:MAG: 50S ribosomal protein L6 [Bacilli bacterium]